METPQTPGTITAEERRTFDRIFQDIAVRGLKPQRQQDVPPPTDKARKITRLIIEAASEEAGQAPNNNHPIAPVFYAQAIEDRNKYLLRFPVSLRNAASRTFDLLQSEGPPRPQTVVDVGRDGEKEVKEWEPSKNSMMRMVELEAKRYPEFKRIETLMMEAKTDLELWDVMESEVFTLPDKLGIRSPSLDLVRPEDEDEPIAQKKEDEPKKMRGKKKKAKLTEKVGEDSSKQDDAAATKTAKTENMEQQPTLSLYVYGPMYPQLLLIGLRRLDRGFATPSRLSLNMLPRIKALGLESYVLGVSTPFYNQLLEIYYFQYGDLAKMLELLEEMRHAGLWLDQGTVSVLNKAYYQTRELSNGVISGPFAEAIMTMPEYELDLRRRIKHWARAIDISIDQQQKDVNFHKLRRG